MRNCYAHSDTYSQGILHAAKARGLMMGTHIKGAYVPFVDIEGRPACDETNILSARPYRQRGRKFLSGQHTWQGALLYVETAKLDFDPDESIEISISNAWPGVEILGEIFVQLGRRYDHEQYQLVAIEHGEIAFIADRNRRYKKATCDRGVLTWSIPTVDEFARYLAARAITKLYDHRGLLWTQKTLGQLNARQYWCDTLAARLRSREAAR